MEGKKISGKIILFGEYTILEGGRALATPLSLLSGQWKFAKNRGLTPYLEELIAFGKFLSKISNQLTFNIDTDSFLKDLEDGMYFHSNIPVGYGAGSSGAIVAAVCDKYSDLKIDDATDLTQLKTEIGLMENHFHGASSGVDPLISLLNSPLLIEKNKTISKAIVPKQSKTTLFLLDTGMSRKTGPLVQVFKEKMKMVDYANSIHKNLIPNNDSAIDQLLANDEDGLKDSFEKISRFQFEYFREMIPDFLQKQWVKGLDSGLYCLKLCGAGGGGFLLGITDDYEGTRSAFSRMSLIKL